MGKKDGEPELSFKLQTAIQCARVASMLAEIRSSPRRIVGPPPAAAAADRLESEDLRRYAADLRTELVLERARRRRLERFVGKEVMLHAGLLAMMLCFSLFLVLIWMELI